jgi:hypothetical protein
LLQKVGRAPEVTAVALRIVHCNGDFAGIPRQRAQRNKGHQQFGRQAVDAK